MKTLKAATAFVILFAAAAPPAAALERVGEMMEATERACTSGSAADCLAALAALENAVGSAELAPGQVERLVGALVTASSASGNTGIDDTMFAAVMSSVMGIAVRSLPPASRQIVVGSVWSVANSAPAQISPALRDQTLRQAESVLLADSAPQVSRIAASPS